MGTHLKVEMSIPIGEWVFEIWLVNNRGWCGPGNHYDVNELEIAKYPAWLYDPETKSKLGDEDYNAIKNNMHPVFLNIARIERGDFDNITNDVYYAKEVGNIDLYKDAIKRFRNLASFL